MGTCLSQLNFKNMPYHCARDLTSEKAWNIQWYMYQRQIVSAICYVMRYAFSLRIKAFLFERKFPHFDEIFVTGRTRICQNNSTRWWEFHQTDISVSSYIKVYIHHIKHISHITQNILTVTGAIVLGWIFVNLRIAYELWNYSSRNNITRRHITYALQRRHNERDGVSITGVSIV